MMKSHRHSTLWSVTVFCLASLLPLFAAERVALVIGNNAYEHGTPLKNCVSDARAMSAALKGAGFEVIVAEDAGLEQMDAKVLEFRRAAQGAKAAWFFYSGHGAEVKGTNYLVPVDAEVKEEYQIKAKAFALDQLLGAMEEAGTPLKVVVLDCCRDNPFGKGWSRSGARGLGQIGETPKGTIIAFATAPGKTADDGAGSNSPFTTALVAAIAKPGLDIDQVFKETGRAVIASTGNSQQPWINSSFFDSFVMRNIVNGNGGGVHPAPVPERTASRDSAERMGAVKLGSSYALGFRTGGGFVEQFGKFGVGAADLDPESFLKGFMAALKVGKPELEEAKLQAAMEALGEMLQAREKKKKSDHVGEIPPRVKAESSYALGFRSGGGFAQQFGKFGVGAADLDPETFLKGFMVAIKGGKPELEEAELQAAMEAFGEMLQGREKETAAANLEAGKKFLAENGRRTGVITTKSGLQYEVITKGGDKKYVAPKEGAADKKQLMVHYKGTLIDGKQFDSSPEGEPVPMTLQVIPGFKEALTTMPVGAKWKLFISADLGYGEERRSADIAPNSVLIFELELVRIQNASDKK